MGDIINASAHGTHCVYVKVFVDIPSIFVTFVLINRTKVSANFVTGVGVIIALLSAISVFAQNIMLASLLFYCSYALDFVDGKVARLRGTSSHFGKKLDLACDRVIFVILTLVYLFYLDNNEMQAEKSLLIVFAMLFLLYDVLESVDSMVWQREIIENLLAGKSVESNFGINTFKPVGKNSSAKGSYLKPLRSIKKWFPSKLSLTGIVFVMAPLFSFKLFYTLATVVLITRMLWFLRAYFVRQV